MQIVFMGTAGSGKTSLTHKFGRWVEKRSGFKVAYINLDPGCEALPYKPDFDIRKYFTVTQIMRRENLGPSGAMIRALELTHDKIEKILSDMEKIEVDFKLIDTPGQSEVFVFRPVGPLIVSSLRKISPIVGAYLVDSELISNPATLAAALSLSIGCQLRLGIEVVVLISKSDRIRRRDLNRLILEPAYLRRRILMEGEGVTKDLALKYADIFENLTRAQRVVKVSAKTGEGMEELYDIVHETLCECGDLT